MDLDWLRDPLGLTIEKQAEGYSSRLKDDRSSLKEWNLGDRLRDVLTPGTREELEEAARILETARLNKTATKEREIIRQTLGNTSMNLSDKILKIGENETAEDYSARLAGLQATGTANVNNTGIEDYDPSKVVDGMTTTGVQQIGTGQKTTNRKAAEAKVKGEVIRQEGRSDDRLAMTMELSRLDRKDEREARRDERSYQNRKLDLQESRLDRKDRQAAIQQMLAGLSQLGASIAI